MRGVATDRVKSTNRVANRKKMAVTLWNGSCAIRCIARDVTRICSMRLRTVCKRFTRPRPMFTWPKSK